MKLRDKYKKLFIGMILIFIIGLIFVGNVSGEDIPTTVLPLSPVSIYQLPKGASAGENSPTSLQNSPDETSDDPSLDHVIPIPTPEPDILFDKECQPTDLMSGEQMDCTVTIQNNSDEEISYKVIDFFSKRIKVLEESLEGGHLHGHKIITNRGVLAGGTLASISIEKTDTSLAYNSLRELGIPPLTDVQDEAMINVATLEPFTYGDEVYTTIGIASNGYLIPGLGSDEDIAYIPQIFPDPTIPNNVIAPFWTDLNPEAGGNIYAALLTRDDESWVVIEWEDIPAFDSEKPAPNCLENCENQYTFQAWLKTNTTEQDITFIYAKVSGEGAASGLNVGVEDKEGVQGANYEGVPVADDELVVITTPGSVGESHVISYTAQSNNKGYWYGCALLKVFETEGISFDCEYGTISK